MAESTREFNADSFYTYMKEDKKLMGVRCRSCGELAVEPRPMCPACHGRDVEWYEYSGRGSLSTFTCVSIVPVAMGEKGFGRNNPYCTGVVTLDEGPRIAARILGVDASNPQGIKAGTPLVLDLDDLDAEKPSLAFKPA